jgi:tetratricopeptide (TPR) repeat protein
MIKKSITSTDVKAALHQAREALLNKDYQKSKKLYEELLSYHKSAEVCSNLGIVYRRLKMIDKAISMQKQAVQINPKLPGPYTNLGNLYNSKNEYESAVYYHKEALERVQTVETYNNLAIVYRNIQRFDRAIECGEKAVELDANHYDARLNLAMSYLNNGNFAKGWSGYEVRFKLPAMRHYNKLHQAIFEIPPYQGESLFGKTIILMCEQGFGDNIQMIRYVKLVKDAGADIIVYCRPGLEKLFETIPYVDRVQSYGDIPLAADYHLPLMSLAHRFDSELHKVTEFYPYIDVENKQRLHSNKKLKIGIVWGASNTSGFYDGKSVSLERFRPLIGCDSVELYSLQVGPDSKEIKSLGFENDIIDLESALVDFKTTAEVIEELDLVISSDTSVAHVAGAMGKDVWMFVPKVCGWRWGVVEDSSLWYPSMKIFRQNSFDDWDNLFERLFRELEDKWLTN